MLIDWFTVGAQALNFVVLVALLQRFLYKPILVAVDARESRIASQLADAAAKATDATKERDELQQKNDAFDSQRTQMLAKATADVQTERQHLLDDAGKAADALSAARHAALLANAQSLNAAITRRTRDQVFAVSRKTLTDLASSGLEGRMVEVFNRRLGAMEGPAKQALADALTSEPEPAVVRSAFDLPPAQRAALQNAVNVAFSKDVALRFETGPELIGGIELAANGQKVSWSIADYLDALEKGIDGLLPEAPDAGKKPS